MTSSWIPSRQPGKLYIEFQLEFCEIQLEEIQKELDQKNEMFETHSTVINAAIKDNASIVIQIINKNLDDHVYNCKLKYKEGILL